MTTGTSTPPPRKSTKRATSTAVPALLFAAMVAVLFVTIVYATGQFNADAGAAVTIEETLASDYDATFVAGIGEELLKGRAALVTIDGEESVVTLVGSKDLVGRTPTFAVNEVLTR